jgi:hypothetical protein
MLDMVIGIDRWRSTQSQGPRWRDPNIGLTVNGTSGPLFARELRKPLHSQSDR